MSNRVRLAAGIVVSLVCTVLVVRGLNWEEALTAISTADLGPALIAVPVLTSGLLFKSLRWQALFYPRTDVNLWRLLDALNIGYLVNNILPARVGELVRPFVVRETGGPPYAWGLSTVIVERVLDVITVVVVTLVVIAFLPVPNWLAAGALAAGVVAIAGLAALIIAAGNEQAVVRLAARVLRRTPFASATWLGRLAALIRGFAPLRVPRVMIPVVLWTVPLWSAPFLTFHLLLRSVGLELPLVASVFAVCVIGLGVAAPSSPGQVGLFEGAGLIGLSAFTGDVERSVATVLLFHAYNYAITSVFGVASLARTGLSYRKVVASVTLPAADGGPAEAIVP